MPPHKYLSCNVEIWSVSYAAIEKDGLTILLTPIQQ